MKSEDKILCVLKTIEEQADLAPDGYEISSGFSRGPRRMMPGKEFSIKVSKFRSNCSHKIDYQELVQILENIKQKGLISNFKVQQPYV